MSTPETFDIRGRFRAIKFCLSFGFISLVLSTGPATGSLIPIDGFLATAVSSNDSPTQSDVFIGPPSLRFVATHSAAMGFSNSQASYIFQLGANFVDYLITVQHHCVQQIDNHTLCNSAGSIDFLPRNDVFLTIDGFYNYNMTTDSMVSGAGARVYRIGPPSPILFATGGSASTIFNPASGTIPLSASGLLPAGSRYQLFYTSEIRYLGGSPTTSTADGQIHFRVTEVPEPVALGPMALAALLIRPRRIPRRG